MIRNLFGDTLYLTSFPEAVREQMSTLVGSTPSLLSTHTKPLSIYSTPGCIQKTTLHKDIVLLESFLNIGWLIKESNINTIRLWGHIPAAFLARTSPILVNKLASLIVAKPGDTTGPVRFIKASEDQPGGVPSSHDKIVWARAIAP